MMKNEDKTKEQLIGELVELRQRITELEASETQQKREKETLKTLSVQWQTTFDAISDAVCLLDPEGRILQGNKAMMQLVGKSSGELIGRTCYELMHGTSKRPEECPVIRMQETRRRENLVLPLDDRCFNVTVDPLLDDDGSINGAVHIIADITEHKRAETALKESEERYRSLFEDSRDAVYINQEGKITEVNQATLELFGYTMDEMIGTKATDLYANPNDRKLFQNEINHKGSVRDYEVKFVKKNGTEIDCLLTSTVRRAHQGNIVGYQGIIRDITELKQAAERYRNLFEEAPVMYVISHNQEGVPIVEDCNELFLSTLGYTKSEVLGKPLSDFYTPESSTKLLERGGYKRALEGHFIAEERELVTRDGQIIETLLRAVPETDSAGSVFATRAMYVDITERKQAEQALRRERDNFISILESMADGVYIVNQNYDIEYVNSVLKQEFGLPEGMKCYVYFHDRKEICPWCKNQEVFTGKTVRWEWYSFKNNKTYDLIDTPIKNPDGSVSKLEIFRDITDRKQAEEALRKQTHDLGERVKELNCLYGISKLVETPGIVLGEIFQGIVELIPTGWQYPEITCARIILADQMFITNNFEETIWKQARDIVVHGNRAGTVEVYYLEEKPDIYEGPFLKEERHLINAIGERVGKTIEHKRTEEEIKDYTDNLEKMVEERTAELQKSEKRFRELAELLPETIYETDTAANITFLNRSGLEKFGYSQEDLDKGLNVVQVVVPEDHEKLKEIFAKRLRGEDGTTEYMVQRKDGSRFPIIIVSRPILDDESNLVGLRGIIIDVTERKRAEDALRESEELYRTLVKTSPDAVTATDLEGRITEVSQRTLELYGFEHTDELLGKNSIDFITPEHRERAILNLQKTVSEGIVRNLEYNMLKNDGSRFIGELSASLIKDQHGNPKGFIATTRDITERKKLEEMRSNFINVAAHEIRTPVSAMKAHVDLLNIKRERGLLELPDEAHKTLGIITRNMTGLITLINNLLDFTRLEAGKVGTKMELSSIEFQASQAIKEILPLATKKDHQIDLHLPTGLLPMMMDEDLMKAILKNLLSNAIKYTPEGGSINVVIQEEGDCIHITVKDTGIGIPKEDLDKIFRPFHVVDISGSVLERSYIERTGLGLAITKEYVKMHDGSIWVESRIGEGSTFHVLFPIKAR